MNIAVRGIGIISALGNGAGETLAALRAGRSGIGKLTLFRSAVDVPVGEVRRDNRALGELLGIPARETPSRTALLGMIAAAQAVADAAIPTIPTWNNFWTPLSIIGFTFFGGTLLGLLITTLAGAGDASVKGKAGSIHFAIFTVGAVLSLVSVIALWIIGSTASNLVLPVGELAGSMIWAFVLFIILTVIGYGIGFAAIKISPLTVFVIVGVVLIAVAIFLARMCFYALQIGVEIGRAHV